MKLYRNEYQHSAVLSEELESTKAYLINCPPDVLRQKLQNAQDKYRRQLATKILAVRGRKASKPTVVKAMSDLYLTHEYELPTGQPKDAWEAAWAFVEHRQQMKNPHPGTPVVCKPPSRKSSTASVAPLTPSNAAKAAKKLRWAEVLEEIRVING